MLATAVNEVARGRQSMTGGIPEGRDRSDPGGQAGPDQVGKYGSFPWHQDESR